MRQIEEFSHSHSRLARDCVKWTSGLIVWVWVSVLLYWREVDTRVVYSLVAICIGLRLFKAVVDLNREERRTAQLYKSYLDTFSYAVLLYSLDNSDMSAWSRREISRYLNLAMYPQF